MEDSHELDLTYVTERIIAVSFPASCSEESYLHSLQEVTRMLKCKHGDNYLVSGDDSHGVVDGLEAGETSDLTLSIHRDFLLVSIWKLKV